MLWTLKARWATIALSAINRTTSNKQHSIVGRKCAFQKKVHKAVLFDMHLIRRALLVVGRQSLLSYRTYHRCVQSAW